MERILEIKEQSFNLGKYPNYDGYIIITDKQEIKFGISNGQSCCEHWGYFSSEDDFNDFIGSNLIEIESVDTVLNIGKLEQEEVDVNDCMFINVKTSNGLLQFAVYNCHNGYYGHDIKLISNQLQIDSSL